MIAIISLSSCAAGVVGGMVGGEADVPRLSPENQRLYDHYFLDAMVQRQKGNNDAAFDLLRHCLDINPNAAEAYYYLAQYYSALKDNATSVSYFQKASVLAPNNETFLETLAQVYVRQQDYLAAINVIERLYDKN